MWSTQEVLLGGTRQLVVVGNTVVQLRAARDDLGHLGLIASNWAIGALRRAR